jgi:hypothetical protein
VGLRFELSVRRGDNTIVSSSESISDLTDVCMSNTLLADALKWMVRPQPLGTLVTSHQLLFRAQNQPE